MALLVGLTIAVVATWPLASDMSGQLPHDARFAPFAGSDMNIWVWNFWWAREVVGSTSSPFFCDQIFPPTGHSLAFHTHTFLWGLVSIPLQWMGGLIFSVNAMILLLFAAATTATYALVRELRMRPVAAIFVGLAWSFSPYFLQKGLVHLNLFASPWLPLGLLFLLRWLNRRGTERSWSTALGLGLVFGLCLLTGSLQTVYLAIACLVLILVCPHRDELQEPSRKSVFQPLPILVALIACALTAQPFIAEWAREVQASGGYGALAQEYHPRLIDFLRPSGLHPLFAGIGAESSELRAEHAGLSIRIALLVFALIGLFRVRAARPWFYGFGLLFLLAWDPGSEPEGWLSSLYRQVQPLDMLRVPARFLPAAMLFLAIAAGYGLQSLLDQRRGRVVAGSLTLVLLFESWVGPYPTHSFQAPEAVERIAASSIEGLVLTVPYHSGATESMFWQTVHQRGVPVSYVARTNPVHLELIRSATPDLFSFSLNTAMPNPSALALDLRHAGIAHVLFRDTGIGDTTKFYSVMDSMEGWERSEDFGDGVDWWYRTSP